MVQTNSNALLSFSPPCEQAFYWALQVRLYTRATVIVSPVLFALYASRFPHQIVAPLFSEGFPISISKVRLTRRCGNMWARGNEKVNGKLNFQDRYFLDLASGQHPVKKSCHRIGAINSAFRRLTH